MSERRRIVLCLATLSSALCRWAVASERPVGASGRIEGTVAPAALAVRVSAIDRDVKLPLTAKVVPVKEIEGTLTDGVRYALEVPPGEYDLHFELNDGRIVEGADLRVSAPDGAGPLTENDIQAIRKRIMRMRTFENEKSVLEIRGLGDVARALVKLVRTNPTSYDRQYGEPVAIFRWEVWQFRKRTGSWVRDRTTRVLRRFMVARRKMDEVKWEFSSGLGGITVREGETVRRDVSIAGAQSSGQPTPRRGAEM